MTLCFQSRKFQASSHLLYACTAQFVSETQKTGFLLTPLIGCLCLPCLKTSKRQMSHVMRKLTFCICENKDADQLRGNREADQRLCFRYIDSTIPLLSKSEISSIKPSSGAVKPGLCRTRSETRRLVFHDVAQILLQQGS